MRYALAFLIILIPGCATYNGVCALVPIGTSDSGIPFHRVHCERDK